MNTFSVIYLIICKCFAWVVGVGGYDLSKDLSKDQRSKDQRSKIKVSGRVKISTLAYVFFFP